MFERIVFAATSVVLASAMIAPGAASTFYEGKTITVVCGAAVGQSYDLYARFLAVNLGRFIPGAPQVVVENRPGAGTRIATAYVYNVAARDGTVIGNSSDTAAFDQVLFPAGARYDLTTVQYLGNLVKLTGVIAVSDKAGVTKFEELKQVPLVIGANGRSSITYIAPAIMNALSGTQFKIIPGYIGSADVDLAIDRGEVAARGGSWQSFRALRPEWVAQGKIKPLVQLGIERDRYMQDVPRLVDFAENDEQEAIYTVLSQLSEFSRHYWVSPDVPKDRVQLLRDAFWRMANDSGVLQAAAKQSIELAPSKPDAIASAIERLKSLTPETLDRIRAIVK